MKYNLFDIMFIFDIIFNNITSFSSDWMSGYSSWTCEFFKFNLNEREDVEKIHSEKD